MNFFSIALLGTAHGDPTRERYNSSALLEIPSGDAWLIDAGTPALATLIRGGFDLARLRGVFITHMHEDHFGGLPDIIKFQAKYRTERELTRIWLPEQAAIRGMKDFMALAHRPVPESLIRFDVLEPGLIGLLHGLSVRAVPTEHASNEGRDFPSFALEFTAPDGRRILFTGDLSYDFHDFPAGTGADMAFCELTHYNLAHALPTLAKERFGRLIFNHVGNQWHGSEAEKRFREMTRDLPYPCVIAHDGDRFSC